ncbi:hypothetical protein G3I01_12885 [Gramella sp. MT6]|uniref:hypothetical protein n=1 Tax=Gramella sp. MT6 TaxID=2705471 RepID=UPI001C5E2DFA|nr:hypothetical protein [Gramella sp. MT6]QYA26363.1 hypothetical protein G3I01_12885 [Gramella sp. MT6]
MKLINVSKNGDGYSIKAINSYKIMGIQLYSTIKTYKLSETNSEWIELSSGREVAKKKKVKLDKWLSDHQKFIEKK